jgi:small conductance mechanosensitive channel
MGDQLQQWFETASITPWHLVFAVLCVLVAWISSNVARRGVRAVLARVPGLNPTTRSLAERIVKYTIILLGVGIGLTFLGASVQPLLAVAIIVGVVLVLALRGISDNLAAGVILQARQPARIGDLIRCGDHSGVVRELNARSVVITTFDGSQVHVPNAYVLSNPLVNHSTGGCRRTEVEVRVVRGSQPTSAVIDLLTTTIGTVPGVLSEPPAQVLVRMIAPDRTTFRVAFWHDPLTATVTLSAAVQHLAQRLGDHDLSATVTGDLPAPPLSSPALP